MAIVSTYNISQLGPNIRLDASYYQPQYFDNRRLLQRLSWPLVRLGDVAYITNGQTPRKADLSIGDVLFLTAESVHDLHIDYASAKRVLSEHHTGELQRTILKENDVLVTIKGKAGNAAVVMEPPDEVNINQDVARVVLQRQDLSPFYVSAFIVSKYGRLQARQLITDQINPFLGLGNLQRIQIPVIPLIFQKQIEAIVRQAHTTGVQSQNLYRQAEQLLLDELGLSDQDLSDDLWNDAKLTGVLGKARLDAEHYQAKYHHLETAIILHGSSTIGELLEDPPVKGQQQDGEPYQDGYAPYVSIKDIYDYALIPNQYISLGGAPPPCAQPNDLLLAITGATLGKVGINFDIPALYYSGDLLRLHFKGIDPLYVAAFLRSPIGQDLIWQYQTGSTNRHLAPDDVVKIPVPRLQPTQERAIANQVRQSYAARVKCTQILEQAKRKVEAMIESEAMHG